MKTIGLSITGSACTEQECEKIIHVLQSEWHCHVVVDLPSMATAGSAQHRAQQLLALIKNDTVDVIWIVRGGEGSADILPYLHQHQAQLKQCKAKPIIGLSDATAVLIYFNQQYGWQTTYAIGSAVLAKQDQFDPDSVQLIKKYVMGALDQISIRDLSPLNKHAVQETVIEGELCVGNMSLFAISIKDVWEFDAHNKILMIEDWHEKGYVIDRTMKYFQRIGKLDAIKALVFGDMAAGRFSVDDVEQARQIAYLETVLKRFAKTLDVPVLSTRSFGHGYYQTPLPMGVPVQLQCGLEPYLQIKAC